MVFFVFVIPAQVLIAFCAVGHLPLVAAEPAVFFCGLFTDATAGSVLVTGDAVGDSSGVGEVVAVAQANFYLLGS